MVNYEQLKILQQGVAAWNAWRKENPKERINLEKADLHKMDLGWVNFSSAYLHKANLNEAYLGYANLNEAILSRADLGNAVLHGATINKADFGWTYLGNADLSGSILSESSFFEANLGGAILCDTKLDNSNLNWANLNGANLSGSDLHGASLFMADLVRTNLEGANITGCKVHGISAWKLKLNDKTKQKDLIITFLDEPVITVDNLEVAQFVYLLLHNEKIRDVIDTIGKKTVLILGRFTPERKAVLEALRSELRRRNYLPILFDFEKPSTKDFTETIKILAGMSLFVIADISNPKSSPLELQATIPDYMVPFVPIIQEGEEPFSMFRDLLIKNRNWVLPPLTYDSLDSLVRTLDEAIVNPALELHNNLLAEKAAELPQRHVKDY